MYNLHWQVLNTKDYGIPQNRERVFLVGIRNDLPNNFVFPKKIPLKLRLKDILEDEVDEKYYLSDKMVNVLSHHQNKVMTEESIPETSATIHAGYFKMGGRDQQYLKIHSATASGYEIATEGDSINLEHPNSETRRGRVEKQVAQTLTTSCNQGVMIEQIGRGYNNGGFHKISPPITSNSWQNNHRLHIDYRIRKLTPLECFRLQGFPDEFHDKAVEAGVSNSQLYKQAGNSITVHVIQAILKNLL